MRLRGRETHRFDEVRGRRLRQLLREVQLAAVLVCLPEPRADADGLGELRHGLIQLAQASQRQRFIQHLGRIRHGSLRAPCEDVKVCRDCQAKACQSAGRLESPHSEDQPAAHRQACEEKRKGQRGTAPLARLLPL